MDSMRSLNTSLPSSYSNRPAPPEQLLQAFRTAALSVTNLYKSAATDQANIRQTGYQDAVEDLLKFLDQEQLGLQDGEGWRVRQWATERFDGSTNHQHQSETEEEQSENENQQALTSPVEELGERVTATQEHSDDKREINSTSVSDDKRNPIFQFTGSSQPEQHMQTDHNNSTRSISEPSSSSAPMPIRVELSNRNPRPSRIPNVRHNSRSNQRDFTFIAGAKRKLQFPDFFDISNVNEKQDGNGGGSASKRGRFS